MEKKKYQVFISSTYEDLKMEREKVRDAILSMYHFPVGMELFGAADEEQWEIIKETIDTSDYYVLLVGQRYGTVITEGPDAGISYTEKEFRYAIDKKIPVLAFIIDDNVPVNAKNVEKDHVDEFCAFKDLVKSGRTVDWWNNPDDLAQKVTAALYKQISRTSRPGWIRGDTIDVEKSLQEIVELNKEKRKLEEQVHRLTDNRQPSIVFDLKQYGTRQNPIKNGEDLDRIHIHEIEKDGYLKRPKEIHMDDAIGVANVDSNMITQYNSELPTIEDVKKYNTRVFSFRETIENGYHLKFEIRNNGNLKANDVSLLAEFPDDCTVMTWKSISILNPPRKLSIPNNPIEMQKKKNALGKFAGIVDFVEHFGENTSEYYGDGKYEIHSSVEIIPADHGHVVGQRAEIKTKSLLHKSDVIVGEFGLIPKKTGIFTIRVSLMCEEYLEPDIHEISFTVE